MTIFRQLSGGVAFTVRVHPRAKRNGITGMAGDAFKLSVTAPPMDGKANEACIEFFAKLLNVPRSSVTIASGKSNRTKVIRVAGISPGEISSHISLRSNA